MLLHWYCVIPEVCKSYFTFLISEFELITIFVAYFDMTYFPDYKSVSSTFQDNLFYYHMYGYILKRTQCILDKTQFYVFYSIASFNLILVGYSSVYLL